MYSKDILTRIEYLESSLKTLQETNSKLAEFETMVITLYEIEEIKKLHFKYIMLLNEQKFEEMLNCFTEDATEEGIIVAGTNIGVGKHIGKTAITKHFREMAEHQRLIKMWKGGQFIVHPIISVKGDKATGCWTWFRLASLRKFTSEIGQEVTLITPIESKYDMEYKKENGQWKISKLVFTEPWPSNQWSKQATAN